MRNPLNQAADFIDDTIEDISRSRSRTSAITVIGCLVAGAAVGSAVMYLLDPTHGERRRTQIRERGVAWKNDAARIASKNAKDWKERARGMFTKISGAIPAFFGEEERSAHLASKTENTSFLH
ncbi:MAG: YtxH domain-containing protein [Bdellovibrionota bacterium]